MPGNNYWDRPPVNIPAYIKCGVCQKNKDTKNGFSNVALRKYKDFADKQHQASSSHGGKDDKKGSGLLISCKGCTGGQRQAMTCRVCNKTKGLNFFAKAQRKTPDEARCLECMRAIELVLPTSADGDGMLENDEEEDDDDIVSTRGSRRNEEYFVMERSGQYYSTFNDDASSVSNPWSSRASSEVDFSGPATRKITFEKARGIDTPASGNTTSSGSKYTQSALISLMSSKMAVLDRKLNNLDLDENAGIVIPSLARPMNDTISDSDSDASITTVRSKAKDSIKSSMGGVPLSNTKVAGKQPVSVNQANESSYRSPYSDDSDDDSDDDYSRIAFPTINKASINIYGETDENNKNTPTSSHLANPGTKDGKRPTNLSSQNASGYFTMASTDLGIDDDDNDTPIDFKNVSRGARINASGFTNNKHHKQNKNFPRVRPTNMLASDFENGLLFRKNDANPGSSKTEKLPHEVDSEDEW